MKILTAAKHHFSESRALRTVFAIGSVYFLCTGLFSIVNFEHKFLYDGTSIVFHIANAKSFPPAAQREVFYLQQFLPVAIAKAGGSLGSIMVAYVFNVYTLYYLIFFIIAFYLKDLAMSTLYLLVHFRGDPFNYHIMVEELLPGACFIVLLFALLRNADKFHRHWHAYLLAGLSIAFIVRSHPLALVALASSTPLLCIRNWAEIRTHWKGVVFTSLIFLFLIGIKFLDLNTYDAGRISEAKTFLQSFSELLNPTYFLSMAWFVFGERVFMIAVFLAVGIYLFKEKRFWEMALVAAMLIVSITLFNMNAHDIQGFRWWANYIKYDQWSLPIRFTMFTAFCLLVPFSFFTTNRRAFLTILPVILAVSVIQLYHAHKVSEEYLAQVSDIIDACEKEDVSKAIIPYEDIGPWPPVPNTAFHDVIVYSSLWDSPTIQVVYENPDFDYSLLTDSCEELIVIDQGGPLIPQEQLDTSIFPLEEENYTYISYDKEGL